MEEIILLDTDVIFDFFAGSKNADLTEEILLNSQAAISVITVFELFNGVVNKTHIRQRKEIITYCEVIDINGSIAIKASSIYTDLKQKGQLIPNEDILIAATALHKKYPLFSLNKKHYMRVKNILFFQNDSNI